MLFSHAEANTVQVNLCSPLSLPDISTGPLLEGFGFVPLCSKTIPVGFEWRHNSLLVSSFEGISLIETTGCLWKPSVDNCLELQFSFTPQHPKSFLPYFKVLNPGNVSFWGLVRSWELSVDPGASPWAKWREWHRLVLMGNRANQE